MALNTLSHSRLAPRQNRRLQTVFYPTVSSVGDVTEAIPVTEKAVLLPLAVLVRPPVGCYIVAVSEERRIASTLWRRKVRTPKGAAPCNPELLGSTHGRHVSRHADGQCHRKQTAGLA